MSLITCSVFSGRVAEGMACKPYLEDLLTAFATQFAKQLFFLSIYHRQSWAPDGEEINDREFKRHVFNDCDGCERFVFNHNLCSFPFQYKLQVLFPAAFHCPTNCSRSGSPILGAQIVHIHNDEGKLPLSCTKNIF